MAQEVIVYSNVGGDPCHQAMKSLSQQGVPLPMMSMTKCLLFGTLLLGLMSGVVACARTAHGVVRVPRSYDETFVAVLASIQEAEFVVTSQEYATGTIHAEKHLPSAEGDLLQMTVQLTKAPTGVTVVTTVAPPAGPSATGEKPCKCHVKRFMAALESRIPDVQLVTIQ